jgi:hypothetical protein
MAAAAGNGGSKSDAGCRWMIKEKQEQETGVKKHEIHR